MRIEKISTPTFFGTLYWLSRSHQYAASTIQFADCCSTDSEHDSRSQLCPQAEINRERLSWRDHAVVEQHVRYRDRDRRLRIEESAEGREFAIEQVVYEPVDLPLLGQLVRAVQVRDPVIGKLRVLVGVVANKPLATDPNDVGAEFQLSVNQ